MLPGSRNAAFPCAKEMSTVAVRPNKKAAAATKPRHPAKRLFACTKISNALAFTIVNLLRYQSSRRLAGTKPEALGWRTTFGRSSWTPRQLLNASSIARKCEYSKKECAHKSRLFGRQVGEKVF